MIRSESLADGIDYTECLEALGIHPTTPLTEIKRSDRSVVLKFSTATEPLILKYYLSDSSRREIEWYRVLIDLEVKTLTPIAIGPSEVVFPDLSASTTYRMGVQNDWSNPMVSARIGAWLRDFHRKGYAYMRTGGIEGFNEHEFITMENVRRLVQKYDYAETTGAQLFDYLPSILTYYEQQPKTFVYRDFFFGNFIVSRDLQDAFVYDFDVSGTGIAGTDLAHVETYFLGEALQAFKDAYGSIDEIELGIGRLFLDLFKLIYALDEDPVPPWTQRHLIRHESGEIASLAEQIASMVDG